MKTRPSKTKIFLWNFIPITYSIINHWQKAKKGKFASQKSSRVLKLLWIFIDRVLYRCHSNNVLFRSFIDRILFRVVNDRVLFESSMIESSSASAVIGSSLGSSMLFFRHVAIFLSNRATIFYQKQMFCFTFTIFSKTISLMCFNNFGKTDREKMNEEIHDKDTILILYWYYIDIILKISHQFPDL